MQPHFGTIDAASRWWAEKLEAAWAILRARNARDYAVAAPNGIDEARYVEVAAPHHKVEGK